MAEPQFISVSTSAGPVIDFSSTATPDPDLVGGDAVSSIPDPVLKPSGASPAKVLPTVQPYMAARQIRRLTRTLTMHLNGLLPKQVSIPSAPVWDPTGNRNIVDQRIEALREAVKTRRPLTMKAAIASLEVHLREERRQEDIYKKRVRTYEVDLKTTMGAANNTTMSKVIHPLHGNPVTVRELAEEIRHLAQSFPTNPDMPEADAQETALRGIIAILRTNKIPGINAVPLIQEGVPDGTTAQEYDDEEPPEEEYEGEHDDDEGGDDPDNEPF